MWSRILAVALTAGLLAGAGRLIAQTDADAQPRPLTCDPQTLVQRQAEQAAELAGFEAALAADPQAALERLFAVGAAYQELALACGFIPPDIATRTVGDDVQRILNLFGEVQGDPLNGQLLYSGELACAGCHVVSGGVVAPHLEGTLTRIEETRLHDPALASYTVEQYLIESIVQPAAYIAPGYENVMPTHFGSLLTLQALADLVMYLESQDGPSPE